MALTSRGISLFGRVLLRQTIQIPKSSTVRSYKRWVAPTLRELQRRKDQMPEQKPSPRSSYLEWNYDAEIYAFGKRLNEDFNTDFLKQALTDKSYVFKMQQSNSSETQPDNAEMISTGNKLIRSYIREKYQAKYPDIIVDSLENFLMNEEKLAYVGKHIGLTDLILTEECPVETFTLSNAFKAVISALEQSSGLPKTKKFIDDFLLTQLNDLDVFDVWEPSEPFTYLSENLLQGKKVEPRLCNQSAGTTILANYQVGLYSDDKKLLGIGWGESIDIAKNTAALDAIRKMYQI